MATLLGDRQRAARRDDTDHRGRETRRRARTRANPQVDPPRQPSRRAVEIDETTGKRTIDPRIRRRREAVLAGHRRRRRRRLVMVLLVLTVGVATYLAARSSLLTVREVEIAAGPHTSVEEIRAAAGIRGDLHMLDVDEAAMARRVEALPWVQEATVSRNWPRGITIGISERVVRAVVPDGKGGWLTIDRTGRVLGTTPPVSHQFVPNIEGLAPVPPGQTLDSRVGAALAVADKMTASLAGRVSTIQVTPTGTVDLRLNPTGTAWLGHSDDHLDDKVRSLQTMLAQADLRDLCRLDLRVPNSPVLTRDPVCA